MSLPPLHSLALSVLAAESPLSHVVDHAQVTIGGHGIITNHMILMVISAGLMLLIFPRLARRYQDGELVMTGTRNMFEAVLVYVREDIARPVLAGHTDEFLPFLWTLFFFILFNNLLGLLPLDTITGYFMPAGRHGLGGTATSNLYVTGTLAVIAFVVIQRAGLKANGVKNYLKHFLGGAPVFMAPIMIIVEFLGLLVKPFALAIRLFANMTAGHVLLAVLIGFVGGAYQAMGKGGLVGVGIPAILGATAIMCLETFVAFLQAYLFTFLTALFIAQLIVHEHDEDHGSDHAHPDEKHETVGSGDLMDKNLPDAARQAGTHMAG